MPNSDPRDRFVYPYLTLTLVSYILVRSLFLAKKNRTFSSENNPYSREKAQYTA